VTRRAEIVVCGAGIAGVSAAYHLAKAGIKDILIVDPLPPLSLTSNRSTECYRNWWPDPEMVALMNRSVDLMEQLAEQSGNAFRMNRRGYLYVTADDASVPQFEESATRIAASGAGPLRIHRYGSNSYVAAAPHGLEGEAVGADLLLDRDLIQRHYPYVTREAVAALHVRRAGWLSAQQLGAFLLEQARGSGAIVEEAGVQRVLLKGHRVEGAILTSGERVDCPALVVAAGPHTMQVTELLGIKLPIRAELHLKVTFADHLGVLHRDAPLLIWQDAQSLPWDTDEFAALRDDPADRWLTEVFPSGAHIRPEGTGENQTVMMLWDYKERWMDPSFPPPGDDLYAEIALRGLATMLPGLCAYFGRAPRPFTDGGYYMRTPENRLLAGPLAIDGSYVVAGLAGYGIMASCAAGELLAAHVLGSALPSYASAFSPLRYESSEYQGRIAGWETKGQL
jgi:sarcosine oxidase, subunit beta